MLYPLNLKLRPEICRVAKIALFSPNHPTHLLLLLFIQSLSIASELLGEFYFSGVTRWLVGKGEY
jgi:hypothetical protein